jgi:DNA-binding MarR family transcriptional regulator
MKPSPIDCAQEVLDVAPLIMRVVRTEMRSQRNDLSVPEFRALAFVHRNPATSLSAVAEHVGQSLPTLSNLVEGLVQRRLVVREASTADRRRITLNLTAKGEQIWQSARQETKKRLSERLTPLSAEELTKIAEALQLLRPLFATGEADLPESKE